MTCPNCEAASTQPAWGGYSMGCLACCARLVGSARPDKWQAKVMLACIAHRPGRPKPADVLHYLKTGEEPASSEPPEQPSLL